MEVDEGAAAVAGVDGGVGLEAVADAQGGITAGLDAAFGTEDAAADGAAEVEGVAEGQDGFTEEEVVLGGELDGSEFDSGRGDDFQQGGVLVGVDGDEPGLVLVSVAGELDPDLAGALDDVVVGEEVAVVGDDDAGAQGSRTVLMFSVPTLTTLGMAISTARTTASRRMSSGGAGCWSLIS
jgi:hypothetical protein